jgi:hypothetical protein
MGTLLICPPELSGNPTTSHLVAKQEELAKGIMDLAYFEEFFNMLQNLMTWGQWLYFLSEGRHAADFYHP